MTSRSQVAKTFDVRRASQGEGMVWMQGEDKNQHSACKVPADQCNRADSKKQRVKVEMSRKGLLSKYAMLMLEFHLTVIGMFLESVVRTGRVDVRFSSKSLKLR